MLKKLILGLFILFIVFFGAAQLVRPDMTNPSVDPANTIDGMASMPAEVKPIFKKACADCHTHETRYPWYSYVTPVNFWLKDHIDDGRRHMNLSTGGGEIDEICEEVTKGKMPLPSYTWGHPEAELTAEEKSILCSWAGAAEGGEAAATSARSAKTADAKRGGEEEGEEHERGEH